MQNHDNESFAETAARAHAILDSIIETNERSAATLDKIINRLGFIVRDVNQQALERCENELMAARLKVAGL